MEKKLPKVFANHLDKKFNNNKTVYYSKDNLESSELTQNFSRGDDEKNIYQKLNEIFTSEKYVYKAEVDIVTKNGKIKTKIIGQNKTHLITMDNQLIAIVDIEDIKLSE